MSLHLHTLSVASCIVIIMLCMWAVLTSKVKTHSMNILALALIFIGAMASVSEALQGRPVAASQTFFQAGLALGGVLLFIRVEIAPLCICFLKE